MPIITIEGGKMEQEAKRKLVAELTEVASRNMGIPAPAFVVIMHENTADCIGVGGELLSDRQPKKD